jgi:hypothetical protein
VVAPPESTTSSADADEHHPDHREMVPLEDAGELGQGLPAAAARPGHEHRCVGLRGQCQRFGPPAGGGRIHQDDQVKVAQLLDRLGQVGTGQ